MNVVDGIETDETGKPIFAGESLSLKDRTMVRTATTNWLKKCMANGLKDASTISSQKRFPLMSLCLDKLQYERDKAGDTTLEPYSPQAVLEEIDFYLTKSFWYSHMNIRALDSSSASKTLIDPEWPEFKNLNWHFMFEESKARLFNNYQEYREFKYDYAISSKKEWQQITGEPFPQDTEPLCHASAKGAKAARSATADKAFKIPVSQQNELIYHRTVKAVQDTCGIASMDFLGPSRTKKCVQARNISMYLYRELSGDTLSNTGKLFERDHTTIIHSIEQIEKQIQEDCQFKEYIEQLAKTTSQQ